MSQEPFPADYLQLGSILALADSAVSPAEVHGISCGSVCVMPLTGSSAGMTDLLGLGGSDRPLLDAVADLTAHSARLLEARETGFQLLLPADTEPISERTQALADWCRGFVMALFQGPYKSVEDLPQSLREIVGDLLEISQAESSGDDPEGEDWALAELEEYVRTGIQLVYEEIYSAHLVKQPERD